MAGKAQTMHKGFRIMRLGGNCSNVLGDHRVYPVMLLSFLRLLSPPPSLSLSRPSLFFSHVFPVEVDEFIGTWDTRVDFETRSRRTFSFALAQQDGSAELKKSPGNAINVLGKEEGRMKVTRWSLSSFAHKVNA